MVNAKKYAKAWRRKGALKKVNGSHDPEKEEGEHDEMYDTASGYIDPDELENGLVVRERCEERMVKKRGCENEEKRVLCDARM